MRILFFISISCTPSPTKNTSSGELPSSLHDINNLPSSPAAQEGPTYSKNIGEPFAFNDISPFLEKLFQILEQNQDISPEVELLKDLLTLLQTVSEKTFIGNFMPKGVDNLIPVLQQGLIAYYLIHLLEDFPALEIYSLTPLTNLASVFLKEGDFNLYNKILETLVFILTGNKENSDSTERNPNADIISMASSLNEKMPSWKNFFSAMGHVLEKFRTSTLLPPVFNAPTTQFAALLANNTRNKLLFISLGTPLLNIKAEQRPIFFNFNKFLTIDNQLSPSFSTRSSSTAAGWFSGVLNRITSLFKGNNEDNGPTIISGKPTFNLVLFKDVFSDQPLKLVNPNLANGPAAPFDFITLEPISDLLLRKNSSLKKK